MTTTITNNEIHQLARVGATLICPGDKHYPANFTDLLATAQLPELYVRGNVEALDGLANGLVVTGARASTGHGEHVTMELVTGLTERGIQVTNMGSYGIDGMALRSSLASGGKPVAWMSGGIDRLYPSGHDALLKRIIDNGGAIVATLGVGGYAPTKDRFLQTRRLMTIASGGSLIVEAGVNSNSLYSAEIADLYNIPSMAVPGPITSAASAGVHKLIASSEAHLVTTVTEIVDYLNDVRYCPNN